MDEQPPRQVSFWRIALIAAPIAAITALGMQMWGRSIQTAATSQMQREVLSTMLGPLREIQLPPASKIVDSDGDLLADPPTDPAEQQDPATLVFSYIASDLGEDEEPNLEAWKELLDQFAQATGKQVESTHFETVEEQLDAMRSGKVHIIGLSTGAVPVAVNSAGLHPLATLAKADGSVGYTMLVITKAGSPVKSLADIRERRVAFVRPTSNSGFKAPLVLLHQQANLLPERDYQWSFTLSHEDSIAAVLQGTADAAPVASDLLAKQVEQQTVDESAYEVVYESETFPPAVIGCAYNLPEETIAALKQALLGFDWSGTGVEELLGPTGAAKFAAVDYKDDWANARRVDSMVASFASDTAASPGQ